MNAPSRIFETRIAPVPRYNVAKLVEQETHFYAKQTALLNKLFERTGQREEWRNDFLGALEDFIAGQEAELNRAVEDSAPLNTMHDHQRAVFNASRGVS